MVIWCTVPVFLVVMVIEIFDRSMPHEPYWLMLVSPSVIVPFNELTILDELNTPLWIAVAGNFVVYAAVLAWFRYLCLSRADPLPGSGASSSS